MSESMPAPLYSADLGGDKLFCATQEDAAGLRRAGDILDRPAGETYLQTEIDYLSALLQHYGRHRASRILRQRYSMQFR